MTSIKRFIYKIIERLKCRNDKKGLFTQLYKYMRTPARVKNEKKIKFTAQTVQQKP